MSLRLRRRHRRSELPSIAVAHRGAIGSSPMGDGPSDDGDGATMTTAQDRRRAGSTPSA